MSEALTSRIQSVLPRKITDCFRRTFSGVAAAVLFTVFLLMHSTSGAAQSGATGTIQGSVTDSSGALVPHAKVIVTNTAQNVSQQSATDSAGAFAVPDLIPGPYRVSVSATGFSTEVVNGINLSVGKVVGLNMQLKTGAVSESVQVEALAIQLDTTNAAVGQVIGEQEVVDLPLNGRNFTELLMLGAGAAPSSGEQGVYRANEGNSLSIQGSRPDSNQYTLDGLSINDTYYQTPALVPSIDALQEFQEATKGYSAAYGGGENQINLSTKPGTSSYHGTAYDFLRNNDLDARYYFNPAPNPVAPLHQNQFGYTLGGPVWIPKIYGKQHKTFFFAEYEALRAHSSEVGYAIVPTQAELGIGTGGVGAVFPTTITNPATGTPFPNNTIPESDFSTFAQAAISHFPVPNSSAVQGNYLQTIPVPSTSDQQSYRIDEQLGPRDNFFARYTQGEYTVAQPGGGGSFQEGVGYLDEPTKQVVGDYVHTFGQSVVNDVRFGWLYENVTLNGAPISASEWNSLGLQDMFPYNQYSVFPYIGWSQSDLSAAGGTAYAPEIFQQPVYEYADTLSMVRGRHNLSMGGDYRQYESYNDTFSTPKFTFSGYETGNAIADLLLGYAYEAEASVPTEFATSVLNANSDNFYLKFVAPWVQDDWKVNQRLTVNLGFRYDFMARPHDPRGDLFWLDPNISGGGLYVANQKVVQSVGGSLYQYGTNPGPPQWGVLAPRVGFAYQPISGGKTVLRAGYGIFYDSTEVKESFAGGEYPFAQQTNLYNVQMSGLFPTTPAFAPVTSANLGFAWLMNPMRIPYVEEWTGSVEREITRDTNVEADYLGSEAHHLGGRSWKSAPTPYDPTNPLPASARLPYPNIGAILDHPFVYSSNYNALELKAEHKSRSLTMLGTYTWSHSLDNKSSDAGINGDNFANGPLDEYDFALDYGSSSFDIKQRAVVSAVFELPFGKGKALLGNAGTVTDLLVGGWQANGILSLQTGFPFSVVANDTDCLSDNCWTGQRADAVGNPYPSGFKKSINDWFNTAAFAQPATGAFGNTPRDVIRMPGSENLDFSFFKNIPLGERVKWQTRCEMFNTFNHTNPGEPNNYVEAGTPEATIGSAAQARIIQVAMKVIF